MNKKNSFYEEKRREEVDKLYEKLREGILSYFDSEKYAQYLKVTSHGFLNSDPLSVKITGKYFLKVRIPIVLQRVLIA